MSLLDLRQEARETAFVLPTDLRLPEPELQAIRDNWHQRMIEEHISARVFAGLISQMMRAGIPARFQEETAAMIGQELRHGRLCAGVLRSFGGEPVALLPALPEVPAHLDVAPLEVVLRNTLAISCLNETVGVALMETDRNRVTLEPLKSILREITADEVNHARIGWRLLEEVADQIDAPMRERLSRYLVPSFHQLAQRTGIGNRSRASATGRDYAVSDGPSINALLFDTVQQVIIPGLERHGLAAGAAWRRAIAG